MVEEKLVHLYEKAKKLSLIKKRKNKREEEDFAGWTIERYLLGKGLKQNLDYAFIDYLRESYQCRRNVNQRTHCSIEELSIQEKTKWLSYEKNDDYRFIHDRFLRAAYFKLLPREKIYFNLYFIEQWSQKEISNQLHLSSAMCSFILKKVVEKFKKSCHPKIYD